MPVLGMGGYFFRAKDPAALKAALDAHLRRSAASLIGDITRAEGREPASKEAPVSPDATH